MEEEQTTPWQWPKEKVQKDKQDLQNIHIKAIDGVTQTPTKNQCTYFNSQVNKEGDIP